MKLDELEKLLELLDEFKTRNLHNDNQKPDYPYDILGFSEWLEFEKIPELKGFLNG